MIITKEPIVNIKSNLLICRFTNFLFSDMYFQIFNDNDLLVYEGNFDYNVVLNIPNLDYGKYYFYGVISYNGYIIGDKVYEFVIDGMNGIVLFSVNSRFLSRFILMGIGFESDSLAISVFD